MEKINPITKEEIFERNKLSSKIDERILYVISKIDEAFGLNLSEKAELKNKTNLIKNIKTKLSKEEIELLKLISLEELNENLQ